MQPLTLVVGGKALETEDQVVFDVYVINLHMVEVLDSPVSTGTAS